MKVISPKSINPYVEKLLDLMMVEYEPEQVPVKVDAKAMKNNCYGNVEKRVMQEGGKIHYGWTIWQSENLCEAEHHAVWEDDNGNLLDISPRDEEIDTIMFVSDKKMVYKGDAIDNVRMNISGNPVYDDFIKVCETIEELYRLGTRKNDEEVSLPTLVAQFIYKYSALKMGISSFAMGGGKMGSTCFCGSLRPYSKCHGKDLRRQANIDIQTARNMSNTKN